MKRSEISNKEIDIPTVWTMVEAQAHTGLGRTTMMQMLATGKIKYKKVAKRYFINAQSLVDFIASNEEIR